VTDQSEMPEPVWDAPPVIPAAVTPVPLVPQYPDASARPSRENHLITISITPGKPPMVVVRGDSAVEINGLLEELEAEGVYIQMAAADQQLKNSAPPAETVIRQLGATQVAQQPGYAAASPAHQQVAQAYPSPQFPPGPPAPSGGQPPFGGPAPQWGGNGAGAGAVAPAGWYRVGIPYQQKAAGDQVKNWLKAQGLYQGNMKWDGASKTWLVSPQIVQHFQQWGPTAA
jgi:hypothetical protein